MNRLTRKLLAGAAAVSLLVAVAGTAGADQVPNEVAADSAATFVAGGSAEIKFKVNANGGDGQTGCNVSDGSSATLTLNPPAGVTASPTTLNFTTCGTFQNVVFTSTTPGNYSWTPSIADSGVGGYSVHSVTLTVLPGAPADTAAPTWSCDPATAPTAWQATEGSHSCTASDPSGLKAGSPAAFTLTTTVGAGNEDGSASTSSQLLCDTLDNCTTAGPITGWKIDRKAPTNIQFSVDITDGASYYFGFVPPDNMACSAVDGGSGLASCGVTGYSASVGSHTLTATATDNVGNADTATLGYTVLAWTLTGFYSPVDMGGVYNVVKGGSTVPLKFEVFAGPTELTNTSAVLSFVQTKIACDGSSPTDEVEVVTTGGTSLRYDSTGGQFIQNWQTPKLPGQCYRVTMTTLDGSSLVAYFRLK